MSNLPPSYVTVIQYFYGGLNDLDIEIIKKWVAQEIELAKSKEDNDYN